MQFIKNTLSKKYLNHIFNKSTKYFATGQGANNTQSTLNASEVKTFSKINDWWDGTGSMATLHAYNIARVNYIKKTWIINNSEKNLDIGFPFLGMNILDVGCGGGILAENLARLGGNVTGIDATPEAIEIAKKHASFDKSLNKLNYEIELSESYALRHKEHFDLVVSSEVIEHVDNPSFFVQNIADLTKKGGYVFISTINRTISSYGLLILGAEYLTRSISIGTHDWNKFIQPQELESWTTKAGLRTLGLQGFKYNFLNNVMEETTNKSINYFIACKKL